MRTLLIYLSLFFLSIASIHAQSMKKMAQKTEFESRLAKEAQTVESIESDFTQVKYLDVFDEKVTSKGKFYYQKTHKICMEYFRPGSRRFRILARTLSGAGCCVSSVRMLHPIEVYPNCRTAFAIVGLVTPNGGRNKLTGCEVTRSSSH